MTDLRKMNCDEFSLTTRIIAVDDALDKADVTLVMAIAAIDKLLPPDEDAIAALVIARQASEKITKARSALARMGGRKFSTRPRPRI